MTTKTHVNGNTPKGANVETEKTETLPARQEVKTEKLTVKQQDTVDDKIRKVLLLSELVQQRRTLLNHLDRVESLKFGEFDERDFIDLKTSTGNSYQIKSVTLCKKVADLIKREILLHIGQVEEMIQL